jgi:hypothetical protein
VAAIRPTGVSDLGTIAPTDVSVSMMIRSTGWPAASARRFACSMMAPARLAGFGLVERCVDGQPRQHAACRPHLLGVGTSGAGGLVCPRGRLTPHYR